MSSQTQKVEEFNHAPMTQEEQAKKHEAKVKLTEKAEAKKDAKDLKKLGLKPKAPKTAKPTKTVATRKPAKAKATPDRKTIDVSDVPESSLQKAWKAEPVEATKDGKCGLCKKEKATHRNLGLGDRCYRMRRKVQLRENNKTWDKRVKKGTAGHHASYNGAPTEWAKEAKKPEVEKYVKNLKTVDRIKENAKLLKVKVPKKLLEGTAA